MTEEVRLYQLKPGFARRNNMLIYFVAKPLVETDKAYYLYGHGSGETTKMGICCCCGRTLTHPVSVLLGIGPECGGHFHDWKAVGGYTEENLARLRIVLKDIKQEGWIPKSQIVSKMPSNETVEVPPDHPKLKPKEVVKSEKHASLAINKYSERVAKIRFPYDYDLIDKVRTLPGRKYHSEEKCWSAPIYVESLEKLLSWGFTLDDDLSNFINKAQKKTTEITDIGGIPGLKGELYPFQKKGVAFIEYHKGKALIADEMGLGKTIQALAWLQLHPEKRPAIIVVPASLKIKWLREAITWMSNPNAEILSGTSPWKTTGDILIINYDILADWYPFLRTKNPEVVIFDEVHYIKSNAARRTKAAKALSKGVEGIIGLSGTPIVNRPIEGFNFFRMAAPDLFPDAWAYAMRYCGARHNGYGWDFSGATHTQELHEKLVGSIMLRRLKKDVLTDLPEKLHSVVPLTLSNFAEYKRAERDFIQYVKETRGVLAAKKASSAEDLAKIETLKQVAVRGKMEQATEWIKDFLEIDGKLVVFVNHHFVSDELMKTFGNIAVRFDGRNSAKDKDKVNQAFQNDPNIRLFVGGTKAAGIGLDLYASSNVAFLELPWTPGDVDQASDRCHRIGQQFQVTIHYLLATETVEDRIVRLLDQKRKVVDAIHDGKVTSEESLLTELLKEYAEIDDGNES